MLKGIPLLNHGRSDIMAVAPYDFSGAVRVVPKYLETLNPYVVVHPATGELISHFTRVMARASKVGALLLEPMWFQDATKFWNEWRGTDLNPTVRGYTDLAGLLLMIQHGAAIQTSSVRYNDAYLTGTEYTTGVVADPSGKERQVTNAGNSAPVLMSSMLNDAAKSLVVKGELFPLTGPYCAQDGVVGVASRANSYQSLVSQTAALTQAELTFVLSRLITHQFFADVMPPPGVNRPAWQQLIVYARLTVAAARTAFDAVVPRCARWLDIVRLPQIKEKLKLAMTDNDITEMEHQFEECSKQPVSPMISQLFKFFVHRNGQTPWAPSTLVVPINNHSELSAALQPSATGDGLLADLQLEFTKGEASTFSLEPDELADRAKDEARNAFKLLSELERLRKTVLGTESIAVDAYDSHRGAVALARTAMPFRAYSTDLQLHFADGRFTSSRYSDLLDFLSQPQFPANKFEGVPWDGPLALGEYETNDEGVLVLTGLEPAHPSASISMYMEEYYPELDADYLNKKISLKMLRSIGEYQGEKDATIYFQPDPRLLMALLGTSGKRGAAWKVLEKDVNEWNRLYKRKEGPPQSIMKGEEITPGSHVPMVSAVYISERTKQSWLKTLVHSSADCVKGPFLVMALARGKYVSAAKVYGRVIREPGVVELEYPIAPLIEGGLKQLFPLVFQQ